MGELYGWGGEMKVQNKGELIGERWSGLLGLTRVKPGTKEGK